MEDRVYKDTQEEEVKAKTEVKTETANNNVVTTDSSSGDINEQTDELISDVNTALNETAEKKDESVVDTGGGLTITTEKEESPVVSLNQTDESGDKGFNVNQTDESGDTKFKKEVKDESNDLGFLGKVRKRFADNRSSRISNRVDELTGVSLSLIHI